MNFTMCLQVHNEIRRCWYRRRRDGFANKSFTMTSAVRHNSGHSVRNTAITGHDVPKSKRGKLRGETVSLKDSSHSTSGGSSSRTEGKDGYTLIGDAE